MVYLSAEISAAPWVKKMGEGVESCNFRTDNCRQWTMRAQNLDFCVNALKIEDFQLPFIFRRKKSSTKSKFSDTLNLKAGDTMRRKYVD